ncbi:hypothetical protein AURDEDRAFT_114539 [Auricularia subglabra TFB-10046 SS5]|nr:hypothetical protein AURDEDRAFT_114539 [Auricularia subglabra TFB-10046 SS5]
MRARYQPDWVPSWTTLKGPRRDTTYYEDGVSVMRHNIIDAVRATDNRPVVLKMIEEEQDASELHAAYFSGPHCRDDPRNHCCPLLETLRLDGIYPGRVILVLPRFLPWNLWPFDQIGEALEFFDQIFEGMAFMHDQNFAHLDVGVNNIMMDGLHLLKEANHPIKPHRALHSPRDVRHFARHQSKAPIKYWFIDFDGSVRFESYAARHPVLRTRRADKTVPEESSPDHGPCDPFALDIYCLGNLIREHCLEAYKNIEFMRPLVEEMVQVDPALRPTAADVAARFAAIRATFTARQYSRFIRPNREYFTQSKLFKRALAEMRQQEKLAARERKLAARAARPPRLGLVDLIMEPFRGRPRVAQEARAAGPPELPESAVSRTPE